MEHELFQSKLKPSVDDALLSDIIRSSSSGEHSHRTAAMELVFERSIQERRERMSTKVKDPLRPDSTPQLKKSEPLKDPTPPAKLPVPALALPLLPQSSPNASTNVPAGHPLSPAMQEASPDSSTRSKPKNKIKKVARLEEPQTDVSTTALPSEVAVQLACQNCSVKQERSFLLFGVYCSSCIGIMKCVGCGTIRREDIKACTNCHGKFE
jgi:hypothetical protein